MYGDATATMVSDLVDQGVDHIALLARHSAREFDHEKHDLLNTLTDEGRSLAIRLGGLLPKTYTLRAYASPPERCVETAECTHGGIERRNHAFLLGHVGLEINRFFARRLDEIDRSFATVAVDIRDRAVRP